MAGTIVYGHNAVSEALRTPESINRIYVAKESHERSIRPLLDQAKIARVRFDFVPQAKLNEITGTREHQGIAAAISPIVYTPLKTVVERCGANGLLLATDRIQHERNLGMMIRSALAAGADGIVVSERGSALLGDSVLRASAGTALRLPVSKEPNLPTALRMLKDCGFWIYGLSAAAPKPIYSIEWPPRVVLVVGNESNGLRPGVRKACDELVGIPLQNQVESLNAAVSGAVALFQVAAAHHEK